MKLDKEWISNDIEIILLIVLPKTVYIVSYFFKILFYTSYEPSNRCNDFNCDKLQCISYYLFFQDHVKPFII